MSKSEDIVRLQHMLDAARKATDFPVLMSQLENTLGVENSG